MKRVVFGLDPLVDEEFIGYSSNERWNGWACPRFDFDTAMAIVDAHVKIGKSAGYSSAEDVFWFQIDENEPVEKYSSEIVAQLGKLYPIGARSWIWEEVGKVAIVRECQNIFTAV